MAGNEKVYSIRFREKGADKVKREVGGIEKAATKLSDVLKTVAVGFAGFMSVQATANFVRNSVQIAAQFEALQTRLNALYGSVERGSEAFRTFNKVAATTPFELKDVVEAGAQLKAFGVDAEENIKILADLAAFMGTGIVEAASAMGRAFAGGAGAADIFRERGILTLIEARTGFDRTKGTIEEFREAMFQAFNDPDSGITGQTEKLSKTIIGMESNAKDAFTRLQNLIGQQFAPAYKDGLQTAISITNSLLATFTDFDEQLDKSVGRIVEAFKQLGTLGTFQNVIDGFKELRDTIEQGRGLGLDAFQDHIDNLIRAFPLLTDVQKQNLITARDGAEQWKAVNDVIVFFEERLKKALDSWGDFNMETDSINLNLETTERNLKNIANVLPELPIDEIDFEIPLPDPIEIEEATAPIKQSFEDMSKLANKFSDTLTQVWIEQWREGGNFFERLLKAWQATLEAMVAEALSKAVLFGLFSLIPGVGPAMGGMGFLNYIFSGFRQSGGPVNKGGAYMVGERGPEIFVPQESGRIEKSVTTNVTIVTSDPVSFEQWLRENNGGQAIQRLLAEA